MNIEETLVEKLFIFLGEENLRYFKHLKGLTGTYSPVLNLNVKRKGIPVHPVHFREGMQIRNFMRSCPECSKWNGHDFDDNWIELVDLTVKKYIK